MSHLFNLWRYSNKTTRTLRWSWEANLRQVTTDSLLEAAEAAFHTCWPLRHFQTLLTFCRRPILLNCIEPETAPPPLLSKVVPSASTNYNPSLTSDSVLRCVWGWLVDKNIQTGTNSILFGDSELSIQYGFGYVIRRRMSAFHRWAALVCHALPTVMVCCAMDPQWWGQAGCVDLPLWNCEPK